MEGYNKLGVRKGAWTREEDTLLRQCIESYGEGKWHQVPSKTGLNRCRKSCRLRWLNHLKPNIKRGEFTEDETDLIIRLHKLLGNRWSLIAGRLPGRTANDVKNYWNTRLRMDSRMKRMKDENQETAKTITVRPQPRRFMKSSHCLSNKAKILQHIQSEENFSRPSQTSPLIENEIDWWNTLLDDNEASTRSYLGVEDDLWTNFWVEDLEQSTRTCVTFAEGGCRSDFSFSVDFWNNSKEEDRT